MVLTGGRGLGHFSNGFKVVSFFFFFFFFFYYYYYYYYLVFLTIYLISDDISPCSSLIRLRSCGLSGNLLSSFSHILTTFSSLPKLHSLQLAANPFCASSFDFGAKKQIFRAIQSLQWLDDL